MTPKAKLLEKLLEWVIDHHAQGGDYSTDAVRAAGGAAAAAELSGLGSDQCFEAGRDAYFAAQELASVPRDPKRMPEAFDGSVGPLLRKRGA